MTPGKKPASTTPRRSRDCVKSGRCLHEHVRSRDGSPEHHDGAQPHPGSDPLQDHVRGYFEDKVSKKKDARPGSVDRIAHPEILLHLKLGKAYVDTVQIREYVADEKDRDDATGGLPENRRCFPGNRP